MRRDEQGQSVHLLLPLLTSIFPFFSLSFSLCPPSGCVLCRAGAPKVAVTPRLPHADPPAWSGACPARARGRPAGGVYILFYPILPVLSSRLVVFSSLLGPYWFWFSLAPSWSWFFLAPYWY